MSARNLIIALSLTASAAGVAAWVFIGPAERPVAQTAPKPVKVVKSARPAIDRPLATAENAQPAQPQSAGVKPAESAIPAVQTPLTTEELAQRAARVEQEANHDLRRLVKLLDLDEQQQDQVFQTLAQHSPSWTPGLQFEGSTAAAGMAGSRSLALAPDTGLFAVPTDQTGKSTSGEVTASTDPMDEIMALLSPEQQDTLLQEEMDRTAWWAEVIQQITPPDDVPAIDGSAPVEPPVYEGSTTLE